MASKSDREKLSYLAVRTAWGTMINTRAAMGLLGMDAIQEELTDKLFGDLLHKRLASKIAYNIYFTGTLDELVQTFVKGLTSFLGAMGAVCWNKACLPGAS